MKHPENLEDVKDVKITDRVKDRVKALAMDVTDARGQRGVWEQRQDDYYRKRFGLRRKRNFPWPGYPNHILPLIDSDIQRAKPAYVNAAFGVSPIVTYEPADSDSVDVLSERFDAARKREELLDYRIKHKMNFFEPYVIGIDKMLQTGHVVFKVIWKFSSRKYTEVADLAEFPAEVREALYDPITTDAILKKILYDEYKPDMDFDENDAELDRVVSEFREGETRFEMRFLEKAENEPELIVCDPKEDIVVPPDTTDIQNARWIDYRFFSTVNDLKIAMKDGKYTKYSDDDIQGWSGKRPVETNYDRKLREGISFDETSDELVLLHETCVWYDIDGDGIQERCIATWPDTNPQDVLRFIELPYKHGMWPYVQVEREFVDTGFYSSRGIPALDDDFQTGISASFNNDLANQLIVNTPYVKYMKGAVTNIRNRRFIPGEGVEVKDMNGYSIEQSVNASQGTFMVTQQQLKAWANERIGNQSSGLTSVNNAPGQGQQGKKTAREIEEISFITSQSQSLDIVVFQQQMKWVYYQIDALYEQFGADEEFLMTGEEPLVISRREIQGKFNMSPTGKLENSNPVQRAQKSVMLYQAFAGDPDVRQDELKRFVISDNYDPKVAKRLLISKEEKAQIQQQQLLMQEQAKQRAIQEAIGMKRTGNLVELEKEAGMAAIHGKRFARDPVAATETNGKDKK